MIHTAVLVMIAKVAPPQTHTHLHLHGGKDATRHVPAQRKHARVISVQPEGMYMDPKGNLLLIACYHSTNPYCQDKHFNNQTGFYLRPLLCRRHSSSQFDGQGLNPVAHACD